MLVQHDTLLVYAFILWNALHIIWFPRTGNYSAFLWLMNNTHKHMARYRLSWHSTSQKSTAKQHDFLRHTPSEEEVLLRAYEKDVARYAICYIQVTIWVCFVFYSSSSVFIVVAFAWYWDAFRLSWDARDGDKRERGHTLRWTFFWVLELLNRICDEMECGQLCDDFSLFLKTAKPISSWSRKAEPN